MFIAVQDTPTAAAPQYIALPFSSWPLHEAERLVLPHNGSRAVSLHETLAQVLMLCDQWRSIDDHIAMAIEKMPVLESHAQQLHQGVRHMIDQGLLVDAAGLNQRYSDSAAADSTPQTEAINTLYVRTYCCPKALERLLQSLQSGRNGASMHTLVVIDDARESADVERSRALLASYRPRLKVTLTHITRADRAQLADNLAAASGANAQDLRWWLNGDPDDPDMTAGATFNTALLLSAGTNTAILDDDAQLTPYGDPQESTETANLTLGGPHKEEALWQMYSSTDALEDAWSPLELDPLAEHSRWLGQTLPSLAAQAADLDAFWQPATSASLHPLTSQATVKVSINGILGDPGTGQASWLYTQPPAQLQDWLSSQESYRQLVSKRLLSRKPQGNQLLTHHSLLTPLVGVDNRQLMPPTIPNGRGEDTLFVDLACCVYPDSLFAQLPWMLKHVPEREREFNRDKLLKPVTIGANLLINHYLGKLRYTLPSAEPATRLQWLGSSLQTLAQAPEATLASDYQLHLSADRSHMAQRLNQNLQALQPPAYLADDMQLLLKRCREGTEQDLMASTTAIQKAQRRMGQYSQALASWQTAWQYCQQSGEPQALALAQAQHSPAKTHTAGHAPSALARQLQKWGLGKRS